MKKLKEIRQLSKLTTKQVAEYLELSEAAYKKLENKDNPNEEILTQLSELYCIPLDELTNLPTENLIVRKYNENFSIEQLKNSTKVNKEYLSSSVFKNSI